MPEVPVRWRDERTDVLARLAELEAKVHDHAPADSLVGAFFTHCPLDWSGATLATNVRARIADGVCNGVFLYRDQDTPLAWTATEQALVDSGPPMPVTMSPKNIDDPSALQAWCRAWPPEWRPYVTVAFWQEFQGDFGGPGQPPITAWHDEVNRLADACDAWGIRSIMHAETWHLTDGNPDGGAPRLREFLEPVRHRLYAVTLSIFGWHGADVGPEHVQRGAVFMADYPDLAYGFTAIGDAVVRGVPPADPSRTARAERLRRTYAAIDGTDATMRGHYSLAAPKDPTRDYYDELVADVLREVIR